MTDQFRLADALDKIAEGYAAAAMVLRIGAEQPAVDPGPIATQRVGSQEGPDAAQAPSFEDLPFDDPGEVVSTEGYTQTIRPSGSTAVCPAHNVPFRKGRYGGYCPALATDADDPDWVNDKGYCRITPKSAVAWLRQHAAVR